MIRKDREITDRARQLDILRRAHICRLAFNDADTGIPYIVPLNYGVLESGEELSIGLHIHNTAASYLEFMTQPNYV